MKKKKGHEKSRDTVPLMSYMYIEFSEFCGYLPTRLRIKHNVFMRAVYTNFILVFPKYASYGFSVEQFQQYRIQNNKNRLWGESGP